MKSVLITGGTGFFGKSILDYWNRFERFEKFERCDLSFTILSRHGLEKVGGESRWRGEGLSGIEQILGDVRTFELPADAHYDYVIHAATPARVDVPDDEMRSIIIDGTANAIKQAKKCGAEKFMIVSSGGVYGKGFTRPVSEDDEPHPYTAYGKAKLEAEQMAIDSGLYTLIPRCFAFVGKYLDRNAHFAIGNFIRDALAGNDIVINGDGSPMRSYMYADDLVEWLFAILDRGVSGRPYNVGSSEAISIRDLAYLVRDEVKKVGGGGGEKVGGESRWTAEGSASQTSIRVLGKPVPGAANYYVPVVDRITKELGISLKTDLSSAISKSVQFV